MMTETDKNLLSDDANNPTEEAVQIPQKFRDSETGNLRTDALLKSYLALEKKLSQPREMTLEQLKKCDKDMLCQALGRPDKPEDYDVNAEDLDIEPIPEVNQKLFEAGLSQQQVQLVYELAQEQMVPLILDMAADFEADRELERLEAFFGGGEQWQQIAPQLLAFGRQNLPPQVLDGLSSSYEGVLALYHLMQNKEPSLGGGLSRQSGALNSLDRNSLRAMMRDPKYWRDKDPEMVKRVTEGFSELYGE